MATILPPIGPSVKPVHRPAGRGTGGQIGPLNVSQSFGSPDSRPTVNQCWRCSAEPWVQPSGSTWPWVRSWIRSSPTAAAALSAWLICSAVGGLRKPVDAAWLHPDAGEAVGHELRPDAPALGAAAATAGRQEALEVLDVVAVLVGDDVGLGERPALRRRTATGARRRSPRSR